MTYNSLSASAASSSSSSISFSTFPFSSISFPLCASSCSPSYRSKTTPFSRPTQYNTLPNPPPLSPKGASISLDIDLDRDTIYYIYTTQPITRSSSLLFSSLIFSSPLPFSPSFYSVFLPSILLRSSLPFPFQGQGCYAKTLPACADTIPVPNAVPPLG